MTWMISIDVCDVMIFSNVSVLNVFVISIFEIQVMPLMRLLQLSCEVVRLFSESNQS